MKKLLARATAITSPQGWFVVGLMFAITMFMNARRAWHWGPDTRYYLAMTYRYSGFSEHEAGRRTFEYLGRYSWFKDYCYFACDPNSPEATFGHLFHGEVGGLVATRVVYPLLSVPFVWLFGPRGMLAVPFIAFILCVVLLMAFVSRTVGRGWSVLAAAMFIVPAGVHSYAIYTYTESLAMCLVMACIVVMPLARSAGRRDIIVFSGALLALAFTRQFHPVVVGAVVLAWLGVAVFQRRLRNEWLPFVLSSLAVTAVASVVQSLAGPDYSIFKYFMAQTGAQTFADIPAAAAKVAVKIANQEVWDLGADIPLAVVCAMAAVAVLYRFRSPLALLTFGAVLATFALNVLNTEPSHFRYYLTAYPFMAIAAVAMLAHLVQKSRPQVLFGPGAVVGRPRTEPAATPPAARAEVQVP